MQRAKIIHRPVDAKGPTITLRETRPVDLPVLFAHQVDREALEMAAFTARDWPAFAEHWNRLLADRDNVNRTVLADGRVAGYVVSWPSDGRRLVGYWLGREFWGRGIATRALALFLDDVRHRPLYANVASHNIGSRRVLEKCGFTPLPPGAAAPPDGIDEVTMVLA